MKNALIALSLLLFATQASARHGLHTNSAGDEIKEMIDEINDGIQQINGFDRLNRGELQVIYTAVSGLRDALYYIGVLPVDKQSRGYYAEVVLNNVSRKSGGTDYNIELSQPVNLDSISLSVQSGQAKVYSVIAYDQRGNEFKVGLEGRSNDLPYSPRKLTTKLRAQAPIKSITVRLETFAINTSVIVGTDSQSPVTLSLKKKSPYFCDGGTLYKDSSISRYMSSSTTCTKAVQTFEQGREYFCSGGTLYKGFDVNKYMQSSDTCDKAIGAYNSGFDYFCSGSTLYKGFDVYKYMQSSAVCENAADNLNQ